MPVPADLIVLEIARRKAKAKVANTPRPCGFCRSAAWFAAGQLAAHPWLLGRVDRAAAERQLAEGADLAEAEGAKNQRVLMAARTFHLIRALHNLSHHPRRGNNDHDFPGLAAPRRMP